MESFFVNRAFVANEAIVANEAFGGCDEILLLR